MDMYHLPKVSELPISRPLADYEQRPRTLATKSCSPSSSTSTPTSSRCSPRDVNIQLTRPRKEVHFSDGTTIEEYSSSEDEVDGSAPTKSGPVAAIVDPATLGWIPFATHLFLSIGMKTLEYCDYMGEHVADFLGITSPKYYHEIQEYRRLKKEEKDLEDKRSADFAGWAEKTGHKPIDAEAGSCQLPGGRVGDH